MYVQYNYTDYYEQNDVYGLQLGSEYYIDGIKVSKIKKSMIGAITREQEVYLCLIFVTKNEEVCYYSDYLFGNENIKLEKLNIDNVSDIEQGYLEEAGLIDVIITKSNGKRYSFENQQRYGENTLNGTIKNLEPGIYLIEMTGKMEGYDEYSDQGITWNYEGQCSIYQGWGSTLIGTSYENGKELICNINKREDESGGYSETDVDITIKYRIIQNNTLELEEITINDDTEWKQEFPDTKLIWGASLKVGNVFKKVED